MPIQIVDLNAMAEAPDARRTDLINGPRFNAWFHIYKTPGQRDEMHCHNADQVFHCVSGECTMHFPDGGAAVLKPGMAALITGGSFYQLENSGTVPMVMLGVRSRDRETIKTIAFDDKRELFPREPMEPPKHTSILV